MDESGYVREFEHLAERIGVEIRYIDDGPSGLCTIKGKRIMFIDKKLDEYTKLDLFVRDFKTLDLEGFFVVPVIRELLNDEKNDGR